MAQTMRLWPRVWSPQTKTPSDAGGPVGAGGDGAPGSDRHAELVDRVVALGPDEAHGQQDQLALELEFAAGHLLEDRAPVLRPHLHRVPAQGAHGSRPVVDELRRRDGEEARPALLVGRGGAQDERPQRPGVVGQPVARGLGHDLELVHRGRALAVGRAEAVGPGVAAADDDDALALGADGRRGEPALLHEIGRLQVLERQVDAPERTPGHGQVPGQRGPARQHHGVEGGLDLGGGPHGHVGGAGGPGPASSARLRRVPGRGWRGAPPTEVEQTNVTPSASIWARRRSSTAFSILNSGMP